jgi:omega-amidase
MINIALIQPDIVWEDVEANLDAFERLLKRIGDPVDLILLPELYTTGFTMRSSDFCEPMHGRTMEWMSGMAADLGCSLAGSIIVVDREKYFNRMIWMQHEGGYDFYDKRHLFRMSGENDCYTRGTRRVVVQQGEFRFLTLICYDLRFPVWSRNRDDYDAMVCLANWPAARRDVWNSLLRARALENQTYVIGVNRIGEDGMGIRYRGESVVFNAKGQRLVYLGSGKAGFQIVRLDLEEQNKFREKFPAWRDADPFTLGA